MVECACPGHQGAWQQAKKLLALLRSLVFEIGRQAALGVEFIGNMLAKYTKIAWDDFVFIIVNG